MIDPNCKYLDIYPYTWRNLGEIMTFLVPSPQILYVLHKEGNILKAVSSDNISRSLPVSTYCQSTFPVKEIFADNLEIEEIHVLEESALIHYYSAAQRVSLDEKNTMEYLDYITDYYRNHKGIDLYFRHISTSSFYRKCLDYAQKNLDAAQILLFIVTRDNFIWFDVVLLVKNGIITEIRTLDMLKDESIYLNSFDRLSEAADLLSHKFHLPVRTIHYKYEQLFSLTEFWENYRV